MIVTESTRSCVRLAHEIADELTDAFVIEKNGHAPRADVNGHAVSDYQGIWMVHLEAVSVHQRHGKWSVWLSPLERFQNVIKVIRFHHPTFFLYLLEIQPNKKLYPKRYNRATESLRGHGG